MLVGDVLPLADHDYLQAVAPLLRSADLAVCNLECPLATGGAPSPLKLRGGRVIGGEFLFRAAPSHAQRLAAGGLHVATLANNHIMDYGPEALAQTLRALDKAGVAYTGAGADLSAAREPLIRRLGEQTVAILAYVSADTLPGTDHFAASASSSGVVFVHPGADDMPTEQSLAMLREDLAGARRQADFVIVTYHWGTECTGRLDPFVRKLARLSIEMGADAVIGHHPHVPQGIEVYRGCPIVYSLGNFVFPTRFESMLPTFVLEMRLEQGRWRELVIHPMMQRRFIGDPQPATGSRGRQILRRIAGLSKQLGTDMRLQSEPTPVLIIANPGADRPRERLLIAERERFRIAPAEGAPGMSDVHVLTWDLEAGQRVIRPRQVTMAEPLAPELLEIFHQIYLHAERFPIHELVGYHRRTALGGGGLSLHALGRAIDLNRAQNPMLIGGVAKVHPQEPPYTPGIWQPGQDPYSISPDGSVVRIFEAHGWRWGGRWQTTPDYQHFEKPLVARR